jgi:hypothetical protein
LIKSVGRIAIVDVRPLRASQAHKIVNIEPACGQRLLGAEVATPNQFPCGQPFLNYWRLGGAN